MGAAAMASGGCSLEEEDAGTTHNTKEADCGLGRRVEGNLKPYNSQDDFSALDKISHVPLQVSQHDKPVLIFSATDNLTPAVSELADSTPFISGNTSATPPLSIKSYQTPEIPKKKKPYAIPIPI